MAPLLQPRKNAVAATEYSAVGPLPPVNKLKELKLACPTSVFFDMIDKLDPEDTDSASEDEDEISLLTPLTYLHEVYSQNDMSEADILELFQSGKMWPTQANIIDLEKKTRDQAISKLWYEHRRGRITASKFHEVCNRRLSTSPDRLIKSIMGYIEQDLSNVKAVAWGVDNEERARNEYKKCMSSHHTNFQLRLSGFLIDSSKPFLGASADGIVCCDCHGMRTLEIKCPFKHRDSNPLDPASCDDTYCLDVSGGLKKSHRYYSQVQLQMHVNRVKSSDFVVFTNKGLHVCEVLYDKSFITPRICTCEKFFVQYILPELISRRLENTEEAEVTPQEESLYCLCNQPKSGRMVACSNTDCEIAWFHYKCLNIRRKPKGKWLCPDCSFDEESEM